MPVPLQARGDAAAEKTHLRASLSEVEEKSVEDGSKRGSYNFPIEVGYQIVLPEEEEIPLNDWVKNRQSLVVGRQEATHAVGAILEENKREVRDSHAPELEEPAAREDTQEHDEKGTELDASPFGAEEEEKHVPAGLGEEPVQPERSVPLP